jgi:hypothetical protein
MSETEQPEQPDEDIRQTPPEQGDEGEADAREPARDSAAQAAEEEGQVREGDERRATGHEDET